MAQESFSNRHSFGKTFGTAMWIIGLAAAAQVTAVGWALLTRPPSAGTAENPPSAAELAAPAPPQQESPEVLPTEIHPETEIETQPAPGKELVYAPSLPSKFPEEIPTSEAIGTGPSLPDSSANAGFSAASMEIATGPAPPPPAVGNPLPSPNLGRPDSPPSLSTNLSQAALKAGAKLSIPDPEIGLLVESGAEKRASGNMQGSLDDLRKAEAVLPDHPRILSEIAATYEGLGLDRRASLYWEKVRDLGSTKAGAWFSIANEELTGTRENRPSLPPILSLGSVSAAPDQTVAEGERVILSVTINADPATRPNANEMEMFVFFYDLVDGEKIEATTADTSRQNFISRPYNWLDNGEETIEVVYHQPNLTPEQKQEIGDRSYYGYIIELYYRKELQDTTAFPPDLKDFDPSSPRSPLTESTQGPENFLFPSAPINETE